MAEKDLDARSTLWREMVPEQDREHRFGSHLTPATLSMTFGAEIRLGARVWPTETGRVADSSDSSDCIGMKLGSGSVVDTFDPANGGVGHIADAVGAIALSSSSSKLSPTL